MKTFSIPLKLVNLQDDGFHLLAKIKMFNLNHWMVIDTGASRTVFDKTIIQNHLSEFVQVSDEINAATLFSSTTTIQAEIPEIKIGKLKLSNYNTVAFDLQSVSDTYLQFGYPAIAGIIGGDILWKHKAIIDYDKLEITLSK